MRHTEFWARMEQALGSGYHRAWAGSVVLGDLDGRTAQEAIDAGESPKQVWAAVWRALELAADVALTGVALTDVGVSTDVEQMFGLDFVHRCDAGGGCPQPAG